MSVPAPDAFLVLRLPDGFGEVFPLRDGVHYTIGRAVTNRIVLRDDMCSREHAEVVRVNGSWVVRDLNSLNGTRLNGQTVRGDNAIAPRDVVEVGDTNLVFVSAISQLPELPRPTARKADEGLAIRLRVRETLYFPTYLTLPKTQGDSGRGRPIPDEATARNLGKLYRLAMTMGTAEFQEDLVNIVLAGLLEVLPVDAGAVLMLTPSNELELVANRSRGTSAATYHRIAKNISDEVLATRQAILADDKSDGLSLPRSNGAAASPPTSLICAPIMFGETVFGLLHLYSGREPAAPPTVDSAPTVEVAKRLDETDLELALAIAFHFGVALMQLRRRERLTAANRNLRDQLEVRSELIGQSEPMLRIEETIARVADTKSIVLIRGESGSGKELVARAIHFYSSRRDGPFVTLNCAALAESLLESELFGHEKGAYTGATERMIGKFEAAHMGTIFLDEIGELAPGTQAKFLRVLEGHPFERVGGNVPIKVDVRVVAATNLPLEAAVQKGMFRQDLFYRLQVLEIHVPPLRERREDIPILAEHFLHRFAREMGRRVRGFAPSALKKLQDYAWPGNVRELRNVIERAVVLGRGPVVEAMDIHLSSLHDIPKSALPAVATAPMSSKARKSQDELDGYVALLAKHNGERSAASRERFNDHGSLGKKIRAIFGRFPELREDPRYLDLSARFPAQSRRGKKPPPAPAG